MSNNRQTRKRNQQKRKPKVTLELLKVIIRPVGDEETVYASGWAAAPKKQRKITAYLVQPIFEVKEGGKTTGEKTQTITVPAHEWPVYPQKLLAQMKNIERQLNQKPDDN